VSNEPSSSTVSRRDLLKATGTAAAASVLAGVAIPRVHAAQSDTIQLALVGSGDRGAGAVDNAMNNKSGRTKLVAMADVFENRLKQSYQGLKSRFPDRVDVPDDRKFVSFDGYKHAMDALNPGDVVILATPPAFRWVHFTYAIKKGLNVFMEKPIAVDPASSRKMLELAKKADEHNLKVGVGLMCRHCPSRRELFDRIKNGEMGDLTLLRAYRVSGPTASGFSKPKPNDMTELLYQIRRFHSFLWASGGAFSDFYIHNIDECCWMKDAWPVEAKGYGGRHYRGDAVDQNFDSYTTEYTFADGTKLILEGRLIDGCDNEFSSYAHGTKGSAIISKSGHWPSRAKIFKGHAMDSENGKTRSETLWDCGRETPDMNPYVVEWTDLVGAIRDDRKYNEVERGAMASLVTAMGRFACHTGQNVALAEYMKHEHEFGPDVDKLAFDAPAPLLANSEGKYPVPQPGINPTREY
jgi:predicted dehydrogenase